MDNNLKYKRYNNFKLLKRFLMDNGCYHLYMFNIFNSHECTDEVLFYFITSRNVLSYINGVFAWCFTKEGYDYWESIDKKWTQLLNKSIIK